MTAAAGFVALAAACAQPVGSVDPPAAADALGRPLAPRHHVLIFPAVTLSGLERGRPLDRSRVQAFSGAFSDAAAEVFEWRRWEVTAGDAAAELIASLGMGSECRSSDCVERSIRHVEATHWATAVVVASDERACRVRVTLARARGQKGIQVIEDDIEPCVADNVLAAGATLGHRIADGPRDPPRTDLALTILTLPDIDIPDIPAVPDQSMTGSSTPALDGETLDRALALYEARHVLSFRQDGKLFVARDGELIDDCELLAAAGRRVSGRMHERCRGNWWELGLATVPLGALLLVPSMEDLPRGVPNDLLGVITGVILVIVGPALMLAFNENAMGPGEHALDEQSVVDLVSDSNAALRKRLTITRGQVAVAGMR